MIIVSGEILHVHEGAERELGHGRREGVNQCTMATFSCSAVRKSRLAAASVWLGSSLS